MLKLRMGESRDSLSFEQSTVPIGRDPSNRLVIPESHVSGFHAEIELRDDGAYVFDKKSTNGTRIGRGEQEIQVGTHPYAVRLCEGDRILVGDPKHAISIGVDSIDDVRPTLVTVVARKGLTQAAAAQRATFEWGTLFDLFRDIAAAETEEAAERLVLTFVLEAVPHVTQVALFVKGAPTLDFAAAAANVTWRLKHEEARAGAVRKFDTLPRTLAGTAAEKTEAVLFTDAPSESVDARGIRTAILAPLRFRGDTLGFIVAAGETSGALTTNDLERVAVIAHEVASQVATAELVSRLRAAEAQLSAENRYLKETLTPSTEIELLGNNRSMKKVMDDVRRVAGADTTILILGETGTGKELVARAIHALSRRKDALFAAVNCGALTETLLESELFGYVRGAFTGAMRDKKGLFEVADGGTLFLDELGEMPASLQVKLLRVLQEGEFLPVGAERTRRTDVRIVAATNRDLAAMTERGTFRQDLFYRLSVIPIKLPPLRERDDDILLLARHFIGVYARKFGKPVGGLTADATGALLAYPFPGNVRELENEIERAVLLVESGAPIDRAALSDKVAGKLRDAVVEHVSARGHLKEVMARLEAAVLKRALEEHGWNRSRTARALGISRQALLVKLTRYEITGRAARDDKDVGESEAGGG